MIFFLEQAGVAELSAEVCVVGSGPAGVTLAQSLASGGRSVVLAEAGGLEWEEQSQDVYKGAVVGDEYYRLDETRLRFFGGSSNHWAGNYAPLQPHDFLPKAAAPETAWPIPFEEFERYAPAARSALGFREAEPSLPVLGGDFERVDETTLAEPFNFGIAHYASLESSPLVKLVLHANLVGMERADGRILAAHFRDYDDRSLTVRASAYVLACGGIENARLLLCVNERLGTDLGDQSGALGRYFTEHAHGLVADLLVLDEAGYQAISKRSQGFGEPHSATDHFAPDAAFLEAHETLNFLMALRRPSDPQGAKGVLADLLCSAPDLGQRLVRAVGGRMRCWGRIQTSLEQAPLPDNRVALGDEVDRFGLRRPTLHWRKTELERRTVRETVLRFGERLAEHDVARLRVRDWVLDDDVPVEYGYGPAANHHIGATRMAASAEEGVVDTNCRVFKTDNLYVAGSSVFPSCGYASPTLPIVAMTLRLAEHLRTRL